MKKLFLSFVLMYFTLICNYDLHSQLQCPPNQSTMQDFDNYTIEPSPFDFPYGTFDFKKGVVNGKNIIIINESTYMGQGLGSSYTFEDMKGFILTYLINEWVNELKGEGAALCPWVSPSFYEFSFVFKKQCKLYKCCYYRLDQTRNTFCTDTGYPYPSNDYNEWQGVRYYTYGEYVNCGEKCCEWKIRVECNPNSENNQYMRDKAKIVSIEKLTYMTNDCPESNEVDCKRGTPVPCEGDCD